MHGPGRRSAELLPELPLTEATTIERPWGLPRGRYLDPGELCRSGAVALHFVASDVDGNSTAAHGEGERGGLATVVSLSINRNELMAAAAPLGAARFVPSHRHACSTPARALVGWKARSPMMASAVLEGGRPRRCAPNCGRSRTELTATNATAPSFVTAWPAGETTTTVSILNVEAVGQTKANFAGVRLGVAGQSTVRPPDVRPRCRRHGLLDPRRPAERAALCPRVRLGSSTPVKGRRAGGEGWSRFVPELSVVGLWWCPGLGSETARVTKPP